MSTSPRHPSPSWTQRLRSWSIRYAAAVSLNLALIGAPPRGLRPGALPIVRQRSASLVDGVWDPLEVVGRKRRVILLSDLGEAARAPAGVSLN